MNPAEDIESPEPTKATTESMAEVITDVITDVPSNNGAVAEQAEASPEIITGTTPINEEVVVEHTAEAMTDVATDEVMKEVAPEKVTEEDTSKGTDEGTPHQVQTDAQQEAKKRELDTETVAETAAEMPQSPLKKRRTETQTGESKDKGSTAEETEEDILQKSLLEMASEDPLLKLSEKEAEEFAKELKYDKRFAPLDEALSNAQESIERLEFSKEVLKPVAKIDEENFMHSVDILIDLKNERKNLLSYKDGMKNDKFEERIAEAHRKRVIAENKDLQNKAQMHAYETEIRKQMEIIQRLETARERLETRLKEQFQREKGSGKILLQKNEAEEEAEGI